jgi:hypothetical protein
MPTNNLRSLDQIDGILEKRLFEKLDSDLKKKIKVDLEAAGFVVKAVRFSYKKREVSVKVLHEGEELRVICTQKTAPEEKI